MTAAIVAAGLSAQQQEPQDAQQRPLFRGGSRFVRVDVFPTDADGKPIEGLTAGDFEIYEDGARQSIDTFEFVDIVPEMEDARRDPNSQAEGDAWAKDPRARLFVIVLDTRHVDVLGGARIRRPLIEMLDRLIGPRDVFGVTTPDMSPSELMLGRRTLTAADMLERHWAWGRADGFANRDPIQEFFEGCYALRSQGNLVPELVARYRGRETLQHLDGLVGRLDTIRDEKKAVLVVTQGWTQYGRNDAALERLSPSVPGIYSGGGRISTSPSVSGSAMPDAASCNAQAAELLQFDTQRFFRDLLAKAQAANVSFYPVDPRGLAVFDESIGQARGSVSDDFASLRTKRDSLVELAINTDGTPLIYSNDLSSTLRKLAEGLSRYYLLGYYSTNTKFDGRYRKLDVKVKKPGVTVKARRGYTAPTQAEIDSIAAARDAAAAPVPAETLAITAALARLADVRHDRDLFLQAVRVPGAVIVSAEIGVNARQDAAWAKGGDVRLIVSSGGNQVVETRSLAAMQSGVVVRVPVGDEGDVRIDARARGAGSGSLGAADATLAVPAPVKSLIGPVLSYRGLARARMPAADGRYRRTERATLEAPLAEGAIPAGARLLDRAGKPLPVPVASRERVDANGVRWMVAEAALAPLTEGDYIIELEAVKDAARETALFAIRVVR
jgi:VWFA-related protein